jgi:predicted NUDIX family phosphoesterase
MNKKYEQPIMVVKREKLFKKEYFQGFSFAEKINYKERILKNFIYIKRKEAEESKDYKQPIGYIILMDRNKKIFSYQRAEKNKDYTEKRLQGKWSIGIGGHVDKEDRNKKDPIRASILREINEEVTVITEKIELLGYINDESDNVGEVHFGLLYLASVVGDIIPKGKEIKDSKMVTIEEAITTKDNVELWSKIALSTLDKVL